MSFRPVRLVCATRRSEAEFWRITLLGRSLELMPPSLRPELAIRFDNVGMRRMGLPAIYNRAIEGCPPSRHILFVHDDVFIHDAFVCHRITEGLSGAHVIGLAGSSGSSPGQPSWGLEFDADLNGLGWQQGPGVRLSGAVSHAPGRVPCINPPTVALGQYGPLSAECDLLDGLFLAARVDKLHATGVRFDERFDFHLYDIDFCRTAREAGLRLWTWPILVTHGSGGDFCTPEWKAGARRYLDKWQSTTLPSSVRASSTEVHPTA